MGVRGENGTTLSVEAWPRPWQLVQGRPADALGKALPTFGQGSVHPSLGGGDCSSRVGVAGEAAKTGREGQEVHGSAQAVDLQATDDHVAAMAVGVVVEELYRPGF